MLLLTGCADPAPAPTGQADGLAQADAKPAKLGLCVACHGEDGRSRIPAAPHIAGQNPIYLVWALNQYKAGQREGDVMNAIVGALNDNDIEILARWYAGQPCDGASAP